MLLIHGQFYFVCGANYSQGTHLSNSLHQVTTHVIIEPIIYNAIKHSQPRECLANQTRPTSVGVMTVNRRRITQRNCRIKFKEDRVFGHIHCVVRASVRPGTQAGLCFVPRWSDGHLQVALPDWTPSPAQSGNTASKPRVSYRVCGVLRFASRD